MTTEFPSNSNTSKARQNEPEREKLDQVTTNAVVRRKRPLGKRVTEAVIGGEARSVWNYVLMDVVLPAARDLIVDAGQEGIRRMVYGETAASSRRSTRGYSRPFEDVSRYHGSGRKAAQPKQPVRVQQDFDDIVLADRGEAERVLDILMDRIDQYNAATVSDLYDLVGQTGNYMDNKYGWTDLRNSGVSRCKNGYLLDLPRPEPLD